MKLWAGFRVIRGKLGKQKVHAHVLPYRYCEDPPEGTALVIE